MATSRHNQRALLVLLTLAIALIGELASPTTAIASTATDEQQFVQKINQLRASKGLSKLTVHGELTTEARKWSNHMAQTDVLEHTSSLAAGINASWTVLGENVGIHSAKEVNELFDAFIASPAHYANLIDDRYHFVGVGVAYDSTGKLWTTHRFMAVHPAPGQTIATTAPPTTRPPTTRPPTTRAPTTRAPTTRAPATRAPTTRTPTTRARETSAPTTRAPKPTSRPTPTTTRSNGAPKTTSGSSNSTNPTLIGSPPADETSGTVPGGPVNAAPTVLDAQAIAAIIADLAEASFFAHVGNDR